MTQSKKQVLSFDEWINEQGFNFRPEQYDLYKSLYEAGQQSRQAEVDELKKNFNNSLKTIEIQQRFLDDADGANKALTGRVDELQRKYDAMYNAFTVADDCRKEWHRCYMGIRKSEDELQERIDEALEDINHCGLMYGFSEELYSVSKILKGKQNEK